ncbi:MULTISPECIES: hypothetical protein [unclassified Plantactinospora]|uniref:hypothetical protein n=1 Tax=unclassified Plantactinospora TaxID=2631981 RepID=UPI000D157670|nr:MULTISPECIES: hypothetical protein [unclassified Plantactinospora]AVT31327.1 hypothetical protein C6361_19645 [Plantactinospora sp. BC1]AVT39860.1 hypothetical protein C6W10_29250 [Plantactinospora sp. BB1]
MRNLGTLLTALALLAAVVTLLTTRSWRTALRVLLDLLVAAGLIRLATLESWTDLAGAAIVIALRQLVSAALLGSGRPGDGAGPAGARVVVGWSRVRWPGTGTGRTRSRPTS